MPGARHTDTNLTRTSGSCSRGWQGPRGYAGALELGDAERRGELVSPSGCEWSTGGWGEDWGLPLGGKFTPHWAWSPLSTFHASLRAPRGTGPHAQVPGHMWLHRTPVLQAALFSTCSPWAQVPESTQSRALRSTPKPRSALGLAAGPQGQLFVLPSRVSGLASAWRCGSPG